MRTAVVRVNVDPDGALTPARLTEGMATLLGLVGELGAEVVENNLAAMPGHRREAELLIDTDDVEATQRVAIELCAKAFGTNPAPGVVTFVSRGTDDDARGVLAAFGLTGEVTRTVDDHGFDVISVTLRDEDLERIPESRLYTALGASLNCEVHIRSV